VVHLGLSQGQAGLNLGDGIVEMMVVQLLHHSALHCPNKTAELLTSTCWNVPKNCLANSVLSALHSLDKTQKKLEGNFFDFDFGFSASLEPLSDCYCQIRFAGNYLQIHLETPLKCWFLP